MMTTSGDYQRLGRPEARGVAVEGTQATLMRLTAEFASNGSSVIREVPLSLGPGFRSLIRGPTPL